MNIQPVAFFHGLLTSKFGIPRQSGLAPDLRGRIVFAPEFRHEEAVRGLDQFDYLWLIWEFSAIPSPLTSHPSPLTSHPSPSSLHPSPFTSHPSPKSLTVRPPRLGGNERVGVFASRSPFRPNRLGLSCVRIERIELLLTEGPVIHVLGADLMDGTPIYDVKPYVAYADAHADARSGFVDTTAWQPLQVEIPEALAQLFAPADLLALQQTLAQDPRPRYHDDATRVYGMPFAGHDVKFRVVDGVVQVVEVK